MWVKCWISVTIEIKPTAITEALFHALQGMVLTFDKIDKILWTPGERLIRVTLQVAFPV